jgi:hypothetical protein
VELLKLLGRLSHLLAKMQVAIASLDNRVCEFRPNFLHYWGKIGQIHVIAPAGKE